MGFLSFLNPFNNDSEIRKNLEQNLEQNPALQTTINNINEKYNKGLSQNNDIQLSDKNDNMVPIRSISGQKIYSNDIFEKLRKQEIDNAYNEGIKNYKMSNTNKGGKRRKTKITKRRKKTTKKLL